MPALGGLSSVVEMGERRRARPSLHLFLSIPQTHRSAKVVEGVCTGGFPLASCATLYNFQGPWPRWGDVQGARSPRIPEADGHWVDPVTPKALPVINPANERVAGHISAGDKADANKAVDAACRAFETFCKTSRHERLDLLQRILCEYQKRLGDIATRSRRKWARRLRSRSARRPP
ncbi:aldehyde dehydrogenase family protein [Bradyrhizobium sp. LMTR 3]|uniref:aldehyde dehydrogenase family protein n=1 Tax=Bradyrhizobium sp. LMTR 3 TaxID=189873 RepID=UPI0026C6761F